MACWRTESPRSASRLFPWVPPRISLLDFDALGGSSASVKRSGFENSYLRMLSIRWPVILST
jgi:hypothetical protein